MMLDAIRDFCLRHGKHRIFIALSGGLDSCVLLNLCARLRHALPFEFHAVHVHHGLSCHADQWVQQCAELCNAFQIPFHLHHLDIQLAAGDSLEEQARQWRYQVFKDLLQEQDLLLTAHHQDDQAETVLLQLMRGAGPKGLAAMPSIKHFAKGWHGRPLLHYSRRQLMVYANEHELSWCEDESNENRNFTRNFIRHDVMPVLKSRWPAAESVLARSAAHCAETQTLLEDAAREKLTSVAGSRPNTLSAAKLNAMSAEWQRQLLRVWILQRGFLLPDTDKLLTLQTSVLQSAWDKMPCVQWEGAEIRRHRDDIHIMTPLADDAFTGSWQWDGIAPLALPSGHVLSTELINDQLLKKNVSYTVRYRELGETVTLGKRGRIALKNLFQEWSVPTWERGRLPLIFCGDQLVQVVGYFSSDFS